MRLAFVHKAYGVHGGTERVLESLTRQLSRRGHDIDVYAAWVDPRFARTRFARFFRLFSFGPAPVFRVLSLFLTAWLRVRRSRYDVVVHFGRTGPLDVLRCGGGCHRAWFEMLLARPASPLGKLLLRVAPKHRFLLWHERNAVHGSGAIVVPSESARRELVAAYGEEALRAQVLPNGVDLDRFHPRLRSLFFEEDRESLYIRPEETVVLFVGSDYWRKGLDRLLVAMEYLAQQVQDLRLLVVGADRRAGTFRDMAQSHGLAGRVMFIGNVESPERLYAIADLLVLPTRYDPFANVTLEALACGLPVVTSGANGVVDVVPEGPAFAVVESFDAPDDLVAVMGRMLQAEGTSERRAAARKAAEAFSEAQAVDRWEGFLKQVASG